MALSTQDLEMGISEQQLEQLFIGKLTDLKHSMSLRHPHLNALDVFNSTRLTYSEIAYVTHESGSYPS